jgi:hypothetical protein
MKVLLGATPQAVGPDLTIVHPLPLGLSSAPGLTTRFWEAAEKDNRITGIRTGIFINEFVRIDE